MIILLDNIEVVEGQVQTTNPNCTVKNDFSNLYMKQRLLEYILQDNPITFFPLQFQV